MYTYKDPSFHALMRREYVQRTDTVRNVYLCIDLCAHVFR